MDPIKAKFYQASFKIRSGNEAMDLKGLVSEWGVTKIPVPSILPDFWRKQVGKSITMEMDGVVLSAVLLQQYVENGTFFEIRFRELTENHRNYIRQRVSLEGISPGWERKFPRIPVPHFNDPDLPVPSLCVVRFVGEEVFVTVKNFTLGGLRIETLGNELTELKVGSVLYFDLVTSHGLTMTNLSAEVKNVHTKEQSETTIRSFGLKLVNMGAENKQKYYDLIKDYCVVLRKRFTEEKS